MPTYVAFLRAINLGSRRRFPKDAIRAAVEGCGCTDVETYINTGNVRLTTTKRSATRVAEMLEEAFLADRGFDVPTVVLTPAELSAVAADVAAYAEGHEGRHYVELLREPPSPGVVETLARTAGADAGARSVARAGARAIHFLVPSDYAGAALLRKSVERQLGVTTNRNASVVTELASRWGA